MGTRTNLFPKTKIDCQFRIVTDSSELEVRVVRVTVFERFDDFGAFCTRERGSEESFGEA